jgi:hypothetical protein
MDSVWADLAAEGFPVSPEARLYLLAAAGLTATAVGAEAVRALQRAFLNVRRPISNDNAAERVV